MTTSAHTALCVLFREEFKASTPALGDGMIRRGLVRVTRQDQSRMGVAVKCSGHEHEAGLCVDTDGDVVCFCDCIKSVDHEDPCAHIWALFRSADSTQRLHPFNLRRAPDLYLIDSSQSTSLNPSADIPAETPAPDWKQSLNRLKLVTSQPARYQSSTISPKPLAYLIGFGEVPAGRAGFAGVPDPYRREDYLTVTTLSGHASDDARTLTPFAFQTYDIHTQPDENDRAALALLSTCSNPAEHYGRYFQPDPRGGRGPRFDVAPATASSLLRAVLRTGHCYMKSDRGGLLRINWDAERPCHVELKISTADDNSFVMQGLATYGEENVPLPSDLLTLRGGIVFNLEAGTAHTLDEQHRRWFTALQTSQPITVPDIHGFDLLAELLLAEGTPPLSLPPELQYTEERPNPRAMLCLRQPRGDEDHSRVYGDVSFIYDRVTLPGHGQNKAAFVKDPPAALIHRNEESERAALSLLHDVGFRAAPKRAGQAAFSINARKLPAAAQALITAGWHLESDGKLYRTPGGVKIKVTSGVDWFDVGGTVEFGEGVGTVELPEILRAAKRGERTLQLNDGTIALLSEDWLRSYGLLTDMATDGSGGALRFRKNQAGLLDALLAAKENVNADAAFERARAELKSFTKIRPVSAPKGFNGKLRPYQRGGLGWLLFLQQFGFGGCLADDMGLGKTPTTLALLERRREERAAGRADIPPSIVVATKTGVDNWYQEAARFTPKARVLVYTGAGRLRPEEFVNYDIILTSHGTLRQDAADLKDFRFDYAVIDEAQFIKNASTQSAKGARLLNAEHRLALTGTPVENHLSDLWSIFEFINPGMLGRSRLFDRASKVEPTDDELATLGRALRPFILRRLKSQKEIARTLPPKTEQVILCDLPQHQRRHYDELRDYYRTHIGRTLDQEGLGPAKIHVLAALTRLRQAACHTGLIDDKKTVQTCGKFDTLFEMLDSILAEDHKCLIFSQFTSLLRILAARLDREKIGYCYMDGKTTTKGRSQQEYSFKTDAAKRLFLISLKTGGTTINLQAADYVFVLDPWWNPKSEEQAIDRAYRDGQLRHVFAYKLIARDTIEEKVLELQGKKSKLADSIITTDNGFISKMTRKEIELLFA